MKDAWTVEIAGERRILGYVLRVPITQVSFKIVRLSQRKINYKQQITGVEICQYVTNDLNFTTTVQIRIYLRLSLL